MKKKGLIILTISSVFIILIGIVISYVIIEIKIDKINTYNQDTINEISKNLVEPYPQFPIFALGRGSYQFSTRKIIEEEIKDKFGVTFIKKSFREIEGELSFTEKKLTINCDGIYEEILLDFEELLVNTEEKNVFLFKVLDWKAYDQSTDLCIYRLDTLNVKKNDNRRYIELLVYSKPEFSTSFICDGQRKAINKEIDGFISIEDKFLHVGRTINKYSNELNYIHNPKYTNRGYLFPILRRLRYDKDLGWY